MKRQLEIATFFSEPKRVKVNVSIDDADDKITVELQPQPSLNFEDEVATSCHTTRPIIAGSSGRLYYQRNKKEIAQQKHKSGYMMTRVPRAGDKERDYVLAHRAVWESFHGQIPPNIEVDHINDNKADNRLDNLQLLTPSENCKKAASRPGWINPRHHPVVPVIATCLDECHQKEFPSMTQAAKMLGVRTCRIHNILAGKQVTTKAKDGTRYTFHRA